MGNNSISIGCQNQRSSVREKRSQKSTELREVLVHIRGSRQTTVQW